MGTRNLTMVIHNGETKIAQYGQWDGYPSGQGDTIREFLKGVNLIHFKKQLAKVKFIDEAKQKEINDFCESIGSKDGWMTMDQSKLYVEKYPLLTRDNGAQILFLIDEFEGDTAWLHDSTDFAGDSLFCEWAYVVDLDKEVLEVYAGFNKKPLPKTARFKSMEEAVVKAEEEKKEKQPDRDIYYPVRCIKKIPFAQIPDTTAEFLELIPEKYR